MAAAGKPTRKLIRPGNRLRLGSRPVPNLEFGWEPEADREAGYKSNIVITMLLFWFLEATLL